MKTKISNAEWMILYVFAWTIDGIQFLVGATIVGLLINILFIPLFVVALLVYLYVKGISISSTLTSLGLSVSIDLITGGLAPSWVYIIWSIKRSVIAERIEKDDRQIGKIRQTEPLNRNGTRYPENGQGTKEPMNIDGIRLPNGGLNK